MTRDWPIHEVARLAGTTSRALRHYGELGLLPPSRVGANGYRYYDAAALVRLQRILLLRELGLGLATIGEVLAGQRDDVQALTVHLDVLRDERLRLERRIASVEITIEKRKAGEELMAQQVFDGFDHTEHREEVVERWGASAYAEGDAWWTSKSAAERAEWRDAQAALAADWAAAAAAGLDPAGPQALALAHRQAEWVSAIPGTPGYPLGASDEYLLGLGELYVADPRFAAQFGGVEGAGFVRDALAALVRER